MRNHVAIDACCLFRIPLKETVGKIDFSVSIRYDLAVFQPDQSSQIVSILVHKLVPAAKDARTGAAGLGAPRWKSVSRALNSFPYILLTRFRTAAKNG